MKTLACFVLLIGPIAQASDFSLSIRTYVSEENSVTHSVMMKGQVCSSGDRKLARAVCDKVHARALKVPRESSADFVGEHAAHYEISFKSGKTSWVKSVELAEAKACDRKGVCEKTGEDPLDLRGLAREALALTATSPRHRGTR